MHVKIVTMTPNNDSLKQQILEVALNAFRTNGVRSVTMDMLSHMLGISKRTLYEQVGDKEQLVLLCLQYEEKLIVTERQAYATEDKDNVLEMILRDFFVRLKMQRNYSLSFIADLKQYPSVIKYMQQHSSQHTEQAIKFLAKGVEQGLLRSDIDYRIFYNMAQRQIMMLAEQPYFRDLTVADVLLNVTVVGLRGCCTERGIQFMEQFVKKHSDLHPTI